MRFTGDWWSPGINRGGTAFAYSFVFPVRAVGVVGEVRRFGQAEEEQEGEDQQAH